MTQPLTVDVLPAMYPLVARATQRHQIVWLKSPLRCRFPGFDVMKVKRPPACWCDATAKAGASIAGKNFPSQALPCAGCIDPLTLGTNTPSPPWAPLTRHAEHPVRLALKPRARLLRRFGHELATLGRVLPAPPVRLIARLSPRVVTPMKVMPARSGWDSKVLQLLVDPLGISTHKRPDLVGRKALILVLLTEPCGIKMRRLVGHATYRSPKNGGMP